MINWIEKGILVNFFGDILYKLNFQQLSKISESDAGHVALLQIKVIDKILKKLR